jgi:hypothetical protein
VIAAPAGSGARDDATRRDGPAFLLLPVVGIDASDGAPACLVCEYCRQS